ncbi:GntR family transcriptional regulator [Octadecabacter ascidiaceicola]|uniref:Putative HTH-type transcriptional regulator YdfH n=1 Tax=Octadecabacter ascidiaceicola TaxID=1655543 RepID=A0A238KIB0_9RHOB|nr:GntR family transcriptional regulator [Octadecabacter ascidiaceicola]SMX42440.1 putative HTH-type transcriptional regulator YdfH [Octadecabacter ascidiaceicola]
MSILLEAPTTADYKNPMNIEKSDLPKIEHAPQTLRDIVQERMRTAIIEGHFAPGERLVERPLCDQLGVSRTVIRETIRYLEAEGLVEIIPNRGPIVALLDWDQAEQIYDIRKQLEGSAAAVCAQCYGGDFAAQLREALATLNASMNDSEWIGVMRATTRFYEVIFYEAGHAIAWDIVQRLNGRISRLRVLTLSAKDRPKPGFSHMTAIYDAILSRDAQAAQAAVQAHILDASAIAQRFLRKETTKVENDG